MDSFIFCLKQASSSTSLYREQVSYFVSLLQKQVSFTKYVSVWNERVELLFIYISEMDSFMSLLK